MNDAWLNSVEVEAHAVNRLVDSTLPNDALLLIREVRRLQRSLGEAVAANLCHVPIQRLMGDKSCRNCGEDCEPVMLCARCTGA